MKSSARKVELASASDLFSTEQERQDAKLEKVQNIPLSELYPFPDHPFAIRDDDSMKETVESVKEYGVLIPAIARPREDGGYELIAGHRRKRACELAGLDTMPVIVRDLDDDTAIIFMVDSNIQRENIPLSEKAKAYKMKLEAIKRKAGRPPKEVNVDVSKNSVQVGQNFSGKTSRELLAENSPDSSTQIQRYIRLNELSPELQQMVDDKKIALTPAVEISYLKPEEQALLVETIQSEQATPSVSQAQRMKKLSQSGELNEDTMLNIMSEEKKPEVDKIVFTSDTLRKYFPRSYTVLDEYPMPDTSLTLDTLVERGYSGNDLLPLSRDRAAALMEQDMTIYMVQTGENPEMVFDQDDLMEQPEGTMFAVTREEWEESKEFRQAVADRMQHQQEREQAFLDHDGDCFAIYQLRFDGDTLRLRYEPLNYILMEGFSVQRSNYDLAYTAPLDAASVDDTLNSLWEKFNIDHPADYQRPPCPSVTSLPSSETVCYPAITVTG